MHLTPTQRYVLLHLKTTATHNKLTRSYDQLAHETGLSRSTIIRAITALHELGFLQRIHQQHEDDGDAANLYRIKP